MYNRLRLILIILMSILVIQFALPTLFSWKSDRENYSFDQPSVAPTQAPVSKRVYTINATNLPFKLPCTIKSKSAISAINRAKTIECKKQLVNTTCKIQNNQLYPKVFETTCPHQEFIRFHPQPEQPYSRKSKPIRIAFILTLNGRSLRQVQRLVNSIYDRNHLFYIHVDVRQDYLYHELKKSISDLPNVYFTQKRLATIWGGVTLLHVLLNAFEELLSISLDWDYAINLSESDFPVKSLLRLESFLSANIGFNFVKSHGQDVRKFIKKQGLDRTFHQCENRMWKLGKRKLVSSIKWDGGSDWITITRDFAYYLVNSNDTLVRDLKTIFSYTLLPAESFFHTVLHNSQFCHRIIDNNLHLTNWKRKSGCRCQHKHVVDWCGCSPNDYSMSDWPVLASTADKPIFFARKFEPVVSVAIINALESWVMQTNVTLRAMSTPGFNSYWETIFHIDYDEIQGVDVVFFFALQLMTLDRIGSVCHIESGGKYYSNYDSSEMSLDLFDLTSLHSVHILFTDDHFTGLLIRLSAPVDRLLNNQVNPRLMEEAQHLPATNAAYIESFFTPKSTFHHEPRRNDLVSVSLINAVVSSNLDRKELMFRNFAGLLSSHSSLLVSLDWQLQDDAPDNIPPQGNISAIFQWIHPNGSTVNESTHLFNLTHVLQDDSDSLMLKRIDKITLRLFVDTSGDVTSHALSTGLWTLRVKYLPFFVANDLEKFTYEIAEVKFMILPEISSPASGGIRYGRNSTQAHDVLKEWLTLFFNANGNNAAYKVKSDANLVPIEYSLKDTLTSMWTMIEICHHQETREDRRDDRSPHITDKFNVKSDKAGKANAMQSMLEPEEPQEGEIFEDDRDVYISGDAFYSACLLNALVKSPLISACSSCSWSSLSTDVKSNFIL